LNALDEPSALIDVDAFIAIYEKEHILFASLTSQPSKKLKSNLRKILNSINEFYSD